eukprot:3375402-Rhodomonas_salina.1
MGAAAGGGRAGGEPGREGAAAGQIKGLFARTGLMVQMQSAKDEDARRAEEDVARVRCPTLLRAA